jgi:hypothetical protein
MRTVGFSSAQAIAADLVVGRAVAVSRRRRRAAAAEQATAPAAALPLHAASASDAAGQVPTRPPALV